MNGHVARSTAPSNRDGRHAIAAMRAPAESILGQGAKAHRQKSGKEPD
jgi:hypothetical protein